LALSAPKKSKNSIFTQKISFLPKNYFNRLVDGPAGWFLRPFGLSLDLHSRDMWIVGFWGVSGGEPRLAAVVAGWFVLTVLVFWMEIPMQREFCEN